VIGLPILTSSRIPEGLSSDEIDKLVTDQLQNDQALYDLIMDTLIDLAPDLIVTQALCDVCAVSGNDVAKAIGSLPGNPQVINLEPICLDDVLETVTLLAEAANTVDQGKTYVAQLRGRIDKVGGRAQSIPLSAKPRVALLDWLDPLFDGGHWTPEIIALAGGTPVFGDKRQPSQRREWHELIDAAPDIIFIALCGFNIERSLQDVEAFLKEDGFVELHRRTGTQVYLVDGNAYFSRPGPRLVDALEIMANALHPDIHPLPEGMDAAFKQN
jgi:iron complex transport system substrate-binding protein